MGVEYYKCENCNECRYEETIHSCENCRSDWCESGCWEDARRKYYFDPDKEYCVLCDPYVPRFSDAAYIAFLESRLQKSHDSLYEEYKATVKPEREPPAPKEGDRREVSPQVWCTVCHMRQEGHQVFTKGAWGPIVVKPNSHRIRDGFYDYKTVYDKKLGKNVYVMEPCRYKRAAAASAAKRTKKAVTAKAVTVEEVGDDDDDDGSE